MKANAVAPLVVENPLSAEDVTYYQGRAEQELELAQRATHRDVVKAHSLMAGYYLDLVHSSPSPGRQ